MACLCARHTLVNLQAEAFLFTHFTPTCSSGQLDLSFNNHALLCVLSLAIIASYHRSIKVLSGKVHVAREGLSMLLYAL